MQLIKMLPEQVEEYWEDVAPMIAQSLPYDIEKTRRGLTNLLAAILNERGTCWAFYSEEEFHGLLVTHQYVDPLVRAKFLVLYSAYAVKPVTPDVWQEAMGTLRKYAREQRCRSIVFYTPSDKWARFAEMQDIDGHFHMLTTEV